MKNKVRFILVLCLSIVLAFPCIASASDLVDTNIESSGDGFSYEGLSEFPKGVDNLVFEHYVLYERDDGNGIFYLVCISNLNGGKVYKNKNGKFDATTVGVQYSCFDYVPSTSSWVHTYTGGGGYINVVLTNNFRQTSVDVYSDSSCTDFFFKPVFTQTVTKTVGGMSANQIMEVLKGMIVSLIPCLVALTVSVAVFYKGYRLLRQALVEV